ncbi:MAG TPA: LysR family transcriptional regulator [Candidatus Solibacter sp.]|jgi:LysR family hydrogen peroxide-inducible transcriptional activator|nr:LysR family transcriptional regulator [Candidatus Solibacter sp.]
MEIHQLRYFYAVARVRSFTRAAEELGIGQSSLSQQIRTLEKKIGTPLFERLGRSVRLTACGEALREPAQSILQQVTMAENSLANLRDGVRGRLRIGVIPTILPYWIAPRIADFRNAFPDVDLQLFEDQTPRLVEQLQSGDLDIAVASLPVKNPDIICSELFREPLLLAVPKDHPLAGNLAVDLGAFLDEPLLMLKEGHCLRDNVLMACTRSKAELRSIFETNQLESIFQLIQSGFGVTLVPAMACSHGVGCALLRLKSSPYRRVGYLRARRHVPTRPMRELTSWLRRVAGEVTANQEQNISSTV